jgi:hypothetical protein
MDAVILRADSSHLEQLLPLFTGYRRFYEQAPDDEADRAFLTARLHLNDSVIFVAQNDEHAGKVSGFVHA